ncbi:MAG: hypothetical protein ACT4NL_05875 [Pseudomarimonas sp.]
MDRFFSTLVQHSWRVESPARDRRLPQCVLARHGQLPAELESFIHSFSLCLAPCEQAWFISVDDLSRPRQNEEFRFDEFEAMSLEVAQQDQDQEWIAKIRSFWDAHFPFYLAVNGDYQYFAVVLSGRLQGCVVYGFGPEFESCSVVAPSLTQFLAMFSAAIESNEPTYPFGSAIPRNLP